MKGCLINVESDLMNESSEGTMLIVDKSMLPLDGHVLQWQLQARGPLPTKNWFLNEFSK